MQKQGSEDKLYAVTDDDATIAYLLKCMRDMDPEGVGIVRSEFKKYTLSRMHSGNLRQNHRLWRRLQTKMQKQGVLELDVHMVCCAHTVSHALLLPLSNLLASICLSLPSIMLLCMCMHQCNFTAQHRCPSFIVCACCNNALAFVHSISPGPSGPQQYTPSQNALHEEDNDWKHSCEGMSDS